MHCKPRVVIVLLIILTAAGPAVFGQQADAKQQILITNVNVWDGTSDGVKPGINVLVEGNLIKIVATGAVNAPGATVIDGGGRTLMPGLIDSHSHLNVVADGGLKELEAATWDRTGALAASTAREMLSDGFTTVRDMGGMASGLKKTIDQGFLDGPRIYPSGSYISQTAGHGDLLFGSQRDPQTNNLVRLGITQLADGADAVRAAVRKNLGEGASQIKIMVGGGISSEKGPLFAPQFTDAEIRAAVEEAATRDHLLQDLDEVLEGHDLDGGAYADLLIVDGNPLEDITTIGANPKYFDSEPRERGIPTIRLIMKDGKIYKNTL